MLRGLMLFKVHKVGRDIGELFKKNKTHAFYDFQNVSFSLSGWIPSGGQITPRTHSKQSVTRKTQPLILNLSFCLVLALVSPSMPYSPLVPEQERITLPEGGRGLASMVLAS